MGRGVSRDEDRVLDATRQCIDELGLSRVTVDDIVARSGVSRATIYRLFPGGRDVLFRGLMPWYRLSKMAFCSPATTKEGGVIKRPKTKRPKQQNVLKAV